MDLAFVRETNPCLHFLYLWRGSQQIAVVISPLAHHEMVGVWVVVVRVLPLVQQEMAVRGDPVLCPSSNGRL